MSVRRPQSMYVPRIDTEQLAPKAQEAPEVRAPTTPRPPVSRLSTFEITRPHSTLANLGDVRAPFEQGAFAEPKRTRASLFDVGRPLHTSAHVRVTEALRDECARLHQFAGHLKKQHQDVLDRLGRVEGHKVHAQTEAERLKGRCRQLAETNLRLSAELKLATESLAEVDAMFLAASNKRMSRLSDAAAAQVSQADGVLNTLGAPMARVSSENMRDGR